MDLHQYFNFAASKIRCFTGCREEMLLDFYLREVSFLEFLSSLNVVDELVAYGLFGCKDFISECSQGFQRKTASLADGFEHVLFYGLDPSL